MAWRRSRLKRSQAFNSALWLKMAADVAHIGYWQIILPAYQLVWSEQMFHIHGLPLNSIALDFQQAVAAYHPEDRAMLVHGIEQAIATGSDFEISLRLLRGDEETHHVVARGAAERGKKGEALSVFGILVDVTAQKRLEAELQQVKADNEALNLRFHDLAMQDPLTQLANRPQFDVSLKKEFQRSLRESTSLGLIMIDLDHFRTYNELYGQPQGDRCLQQIARVIANAVQRPGDVAARYGGEELALLLPNTDEIGAGVVADRIVANIRALALDYKGNANDIMTISVGVAAIMPFRGDDPARLLEYADVALHRAKRTGRNSVSFYSCENVRNIAAKLWPKG